MPKRSTVVLVASWVWLVGCRSDEPRDLAAEPAATEPAATEPAATEPAATSPTATQPAATERPGLVVDTKSWGADARAPTPVELPPDLAALTYDVSVASIEIPNWQLAVVELGEGPRLLRYRPAKVSRQVRYSIADDKATRMIVTTHWWSLASSTPENLDFAFAGIDCEMPLDPQFSETMEERWAATAKLLSAACAVIRGQGRADGGRLIHIAQTAGEPMTPPVDDTLRLFSVPLPSEPVGIGGVWAATETREGMTTIERYRLLAVEGADLTIEYVGKTTTPDATDREAKGTFVVSLFDPIARSAEIDEISRVRYSPDTPVIELSLHLELSTVAPEPASPK